ncbi:MAG: alpha/beta hydrolase family protein, partial [Candidatus Nanoarchaeia archaeon]
KGQKLGGYLYIPDGKGPFPTVIICHGLSTSKEAHNVTQVAPLLVPNGFLVFAFDFHGHGESEGEFEDVTITQGIDDLNCAIEYIIEQPLVDISRIGLFGASFGGIISIYITARDKRIKVLSLRAPLIDYKKSLENRKEIFDSWKEKGYRIYESWSGPKKLNYSYALDAMKYNELVDAEKIKVPTLMVVGTEDSIVVPELAEKFHQALVCEKKMIWLKGEKHNWSAEAKKKGFNEIANWFKKYL